MFSRMNRGQLEAMFRELFAKTELERERGLERLAAEDAAMASELRRLFALLPEAEGWFEKMERRGLERDSS